MRYGMNALTVINGVKRKLAEIKPSLPAGVEVVSGYDRSGLIPVSIQTLQRDLYSDVLPPCQLEHHVARRTGIGNRSPGGRSNRDGGKRLPSAFRKPS